jgi:hypothetical protein
MPGNERLRLKLFTVAACGCHRLDGSRTGLRREP